MEDKMYKRDELLNDLNDLFNRVKGCEINDFDENLFGRKYNFTPGEMLEICMELRNKYSINLNLFIHNIDNFSVNSIIDTLYRIMEHNESQ
jgi:hypothetical protein